MESCYELKKREDAYRIYISDAIKLLGNLNLRYYDVINPKSEEQKQAEEKQNQESAEEIKSRIFGKIKKLGG